MAGDSDTPATDLKAHVQTYDSVTALLKWGAVGAFVIAFLVILLIS